MPGPLPRTGAFGFVSSPTHATSAALWFWGGTLHGKTPAKGRQQSDAYGLRLVQLDVEVAAALPKSVVVPSGPAPHAPAAPAPAPKPGPAPEAPPAQPQPVPPETEKASPPPPTPPARPPPTRELAEEAAAATTSHIRAEIDRLVALASQLREVSEWCAAAAANPSTEQEFSLAPFATAQTTAMPVKRDAWTTRCATARALAESCARFEIRRDDMARLRSEQRRFAETLSTPLTSLGRNIEQLRQCLQDVESAMTAMRDAYDEHKRLEQAEHKLIHERDQQENILNDLYGALRQCTDKQERYSARLAEQTSVCDKLKLEHDLLLKNLTRVHADADAAAAARAAARARVEEAEAILDTARGPADVHECRRAELEAAVAAAFRALGTLKNQQPIVEQVTRPPIADLSQLCASFAVNSCPWKLG